MSSSSSTGSSSNSSDVNFPAIFALMLVVNVGLSVVSSEWFKTRQWSSTSAITAQPVSTEEAEAKKRWLVVLRKYLAVYLLATMADWLQGPYVYVLYDEYGYKQHDIAVLFVAGFGSSMIFGSFVGGMADWGGRRAFVVLFAVIYAASCATKHFNNFSILLLGRLLGGVATSLLFSIFEAWLIRAHADADVKHLLGKSFSWAAYGNSIVAILAGLLANKAAHSMAMVQLSSSPLLIFAGGYLNPFDIALAVLVVCGFFAYTTWDENYGESGGSGSDKNDDASDDATNDDARSTKWYDGLRNAYTTTIRSQDILQCGIISSLFEGSMYIFVFMWTPALKSSKEDDFDPPFGLIFSTFMVSCMAGSSLYSIQVEKTKGEVMAVGLMAVAGLAMAIIAVSTSPTLKFLAMNLFEMMVGMYWPIMGTLKGHIVPENKRAAIYNLFRIPLNFIVLFSLLTDLTPTQSFTLNAVMLSAATGLMVLVMKRREKMGMTKEVDNDLELNTGLDKDTKPLLASSKD